MIQVQAICRIRPDNGKLPRGFRAEGSYAVIGVYTPNATSDPHYLVIDDQGTSVPIHFRRVQFIEVFSNSSSTTSDKTPNPNPAFGSCFIINPAKRVWGPQTTGVISFCPEAITCWDISQRTQFQPHEIQFSSDFLQVTVYHSRPKSGYLRIG